MSSVEIAVSVIAVAAVVGVVGMLLFLRRFSVTLSGLEETLQTGKEVVESLEGDVRQAVAGLVAVEKEAQQLLSNVDARVADLTSALVPAVEEVSRVAGAYTELERVLEERLEKEIPVVLEDFREITSDVRQISAEILERIDQTKELFRAVEESGRTVRSVTKVARSGLTGLAIQVASMAVGMKSSLEYVSENLVRKR